MFSIQWHITNRCNLRCNHCYQDNYMDEPTLERLIDNYNAMERFLVKENYYADIALTGGEPCISENLEPLLKYLNTRERVKKLMILTNGTLLTSAQADFLKKFNVDLVQVSLDGGNASVHEAIRGTNTFERALGGIRILKEAGIDVQIQMVVHKNNVESVENLIQVCNEYAVDRLLVTRLVLEGKAGENMTGLLLSLEEYKSLLYMLDAYSNEKRNKVKILKSRCLWRLVDEEYGALCPVGINSIAVLPNGDVLPCRRMPLAAGNLNKESLYKIWYGSKILWDIRQKENLKGKCGACKDHDKCGGCRAMAFAMTGDYMETDPYCWK